jgi:ubiquinone biosynthesis protein UbiJ
MTEKRTLSFRVGHDVYDNVCEFANERNVSKSDAGRRLINRGLEYERMRDEIDALRRQVDTLQDEIDRLEERNEEYDRALERARLPWPLRRWFGN